VERSPIGRKHAIPLQSEDNDRTRRPSADELAAILGVADPFMRDMVEVALETGFRQGTLRQLTGAMIDWTPVEGKHYGIIRVPGRAWKNKKLFVMPMTRHAAKILRRRFDALTLEGKEQPQLYLFGNEVGELLTGKQVWGGWDATLVRAGLKVVGPGKDGPETILVDPDLHFHDLRAEFASQLLEQGKTLDQIRRLLDHSSLLMTQRYLRSRGLIFEDYGDADEAMSARVVRTGTTKRTTALKILHGGKG
jgi:integrase